MTVTRVMINGLPGRVASETASAFLENQDRFELVPLSFTGPEIEQSKWEQGGASVRLVRPDERPEAEEELKKHQPFIVVDFTLPSAVMDNVAEYCRRGWPFVIGTTGADYEAIAEQVAKVDFCAVANPNMSIPIVLIQSALSYLAENFPGALDGWKAGIVESHQQGKADTSGTAKHMVRYFNALGVDIDVDQIEKIRDPERQKNEVQVPQEYLSGHAYHTYRLKSPDGSVELGFLHNVLGRRTYAVGTIQSVEFLQSQLDQGCKGKLFSMLDVLSAGKK